MSRTLDELLAEAAAKLSDAGVENARREARLLLEGCTGKSRDYILLRGSETADGDVEAKLRRYVERRISGEPLQYILGEWEFMGYSYRVGKGVLIPRPETELLVETAVNYAPRGAAVYDVCAGTGCIGISTAKMRPDTSVFCIEKFDDAFCYLTENVEKHDARNVTAVKADIFPGIEELKLPQPDVILSNPPYVKSGELNGLQQEVLREPSSALDGGCDGLMFYRALAERWFPFLKRGGILVMECGDGQAKEVAGIFFGLSGRIDIIRDFSGTERVVTAGKD